jgi:isopentenyl diphosphate isomerase/L-lactate dehydrogenase-like FMN-dependent dehydrogenase
LWGLGAFGQAGVEKSLRILQSEFENTMKFAGCAGLGDITREHVWES